MELPLDIMCMVMDALPRPEQWRLGNTCRALHLYWQQTRTYLHISSEEDVDPQDLQHFPRLTHLQLTHCSWLTDEALLQVCSEMPRLNTLTISSCSLLTDALWSALPTTLTSLTLTHMSVQSKWSLARLTQLRYLDVSHTSITADLFEHISNFTQLESLNLNYCLELMQATAAAPIACLAALGPSLKSLKWATCSSPLVISHICAQMPNLEVLDLSTTCIGDQVQYFVLLDKLRDLTLHHTLVSRRHVESLLHMQSLRCLHATDCHWMTTSFRHLLAEG